MVNDIGRRNLQTDYYTFYMIITCFLIILSVTACGSSVYLIIENYKDAPDIDVQKALSYFSAITLGLIAFVLGLYYIFYISNTIWHSDIVATDLTRMITEPIDQNSFTSNLANFAAEKTGQDPRYLKTAINHNMMIFGDSNLNDSLQDEYGINQDQLRSNVRGYYYNINQHKKEEAYNNRQQQQQTYNNPVFSYN